MGLETYKQKRDFRKTPEPEGRVRPRAGPLEFVIQKHAASHLHYDFRLELDGVLLSWAVPKGPSLDPGDKRLAMRTEDHPMDYASFEGVIPAGEYGGGTVIVWDRGVWRPEGGLDGARKGLRGGRLTFTLEGEKLRGAWRLVRTRGRSGDKGEEAWLLIKRDDAAAARGATSITEVEPRSVISGRDLSQVGEDPERVWRSNRSRRRTKRKAEREPRGTPRTLGDPSAAPGARRAKLPARPRPMLTTAVDEAPAGEDWLHEVKHDGYRLLVVVERGRARLLTRSGQHWTGSFPAIAEAAAALPCRAALLDGEAVVLDDRGVSDFQRLQRALSTGGAEAPRLVAFDLLHLDGWDLTGSPLHARKELLRHLLAGAPSEALRYGDHLRGDGARVLAASCAQGLEGIVSKRADSRYEPGKRARSWVKAKCHLRQELVVVGFTDPEGSRAGLARCCSASPSRRASGRSSGASAPASTRTSCSRCAGASSRSG